MNTHTILAGGDVLTQLPPAVWVAAAVVAVLILCAPGQRRIRSTGRTSSSWHPPAHKHDFTLGTQVNATTVRWQCVWCPAYRDSYDPPPPHG